MNKVCKSKSDGNVFKNMFVGMDVHKNYLQIAVLDEKGKVLNNSRVDNNLIKVNEFFDRLFLFKMIRFWNWLILSS